MLFTLAKTITFTRAVDLRKPSDSDPVLQHGCELYFDFTLAVDTSLLLCHIHRFFSSSLPSLILTNEVTLVRLPAAAPLITRLPTAQADAARFSTRYHQIYNGIGGRNISFTLYYNSCSVSFTSCWERETRMRLEIAAISYRKNWSRTAWLGPNRRRLLVKWSSFLCP